MPARLLSAESTDLFTGSEATPYQILRVTAEAGAQDLDLEVRGPGLAQAEPVTVPGGAGEVVLEVPLEVSAATGAVVPCEVRLGDETLAAELTVEAPGWTMYLVSHFHYDPVWWNTQAAYTSPWEFLSGDSTTRPLWERNAFALVEAHLDLALRDPDYRFVLAEVDYLKPFFDTHPERRADLRRLMDEGRVEMLGGTYNEPNTNLTGAETTIRNIVYGIGYQRDILGGDPRTAWQLDAFGHDPQFPGYLAAAGLTGSAWARGPFHQWGPISKNFKEAKNDATLMQFPSEFEWISPSGLGVLTHYMPAHYSAGWWMDSAPSLAEATQAVFELYRALKPVAATRNILLPVGTDYSPPNKWVTDIHRDWASRYVWPRFVCGTPRQFLDAVRAEITAFSPQTRDMNPVYTGKDVSYIDTKQAQRAAEVAALDAERLSVFSRLLGLTGYPHTALDKVWRQLAYGAHHDAITGSESDQVYLDLLTGWREAHDLAADARDQALDALVAQIATDGRSVVVTNTLSFPRDGVVTVRLAPGETVAGASGVLENGAYTFLATQVPPMGWRTYQVTEGTPATWTPTEATAIENARWRVTADPSRGGTLASVLDLRTGRELLTGDANELRLYDEYPQHPDMGEGPWHLLPTGVSQGSADRPATVRAETSPAGQRLIITGSMDDLDFEQTLTLWEGGDRVEFATRVLDHTGADRLLRVRFPAAITGALPVSDVAGAVVGRGFALPDVDAAEHPWTLDNPANTWFGLSTTARVELGEAGARALGVAEVVVPTLADAPDARDLVVALARAGVTATTSAAPAARYGWLDVDSNLPDFRIILGGPDANPLAAELLSRSDPVFLDAIKSGATHVWVPAEKPLAEVWQPDADLRDVRSLPALVVTGPVEDLVADLADARVSAVCPVGREELEDRTVALLTYGLPGFAVDPAGALHLSLMRSCTGWPSGVWIDPPRRTTPDGSGFQLQRWTHEFHYALAGGEGDWRAQELPAAGQEFITPMLPRVVETAQRGTLPGAHSLLRVEPAREVLFSTVKAAGNPHAHGELPGEVSGVTLRLVESTGLGSVASIESPVLDLSGLLHSDLLEVPGAPVGAAPLSLAGSEVATFLAPVPLGGGESGQTAEITQPVYSRYWLHNKGPAPLGYLPVSLALTPGLVTGDGSPFGIEVVLSAQETAEGVVDLRVPDGWQASPSRRVYRVEAGGHVRFPVTVTPAPGSGLHFLSATTRHGGQTIEDVTTVALGDTPELPVPGVYEGEAFKGTRAEEARVTGLTVETVTTSLSLRPGEVSELTLRLANTTSGDIHGETQLASPWGTWELLPTAILGFTVPAGQSAEVSFPVRVPEDFAPGHAWALAKVMWFGRCQYSPVVRLEVTR
ncbi:glycoside hydrolase [Nonomuraea sp. NBC_01738]|uniref:glycoside hydrolase family 38 N-terminal domain-containing protein n=1 Tax=Nonomuraea sp. NBC_01738 TaxID=2976003 RepID=UPI002E161C3A|nr:glycoside hydrolase [Nonomuraea sp. NBC_01738]